MTNALKTKLRERFRGFLPVVIDVETGGFNPAEHALLEIAIVTLRYNTAGELILDSTHEFAIKPAPGTLMAPKSMAVNKIDLDDPNRNALEEAEALKESFKIIRREIKTHECNRAVLVGHNATFDLSFINAACARSQVKRNPFHPFSVFDTATLSAVALGHTVLAKSLSLAGLGFDAKSAHSARYDAVKTAELFCYIVNRWKMLEEAFLEIKN